MTADDTRPLLLLVDDEPANLALLERLFSRTYRLISVSSGQAALDMLVQSPFDLVLLDIMMPRMSGLATLERIRANPKTADLPVILVSALADAKDVVRGLQMGANDYVTKPIQMEILNARVQTQVTLKQLRDMQNRTITELQEANDLKDRFFRIASHDLKSPLANICMVQYMLREQFQNDADTLRLLEMLELSTDMMQNVIRDFLEIAAIQSGVVDLHWMDVSVGPLIHEVLNQYRLMAHKKHITLEEQPTEGTVYGDYARLAQALDNLVSNALKYSPSGATVTLFTETHGDQMRICVADQGPGIPPGERDRLFTQFGKLSTRPTDGESSTGLGLWIVKHLTTLQGGLVGVDSRPEGGSIFWIDMPIHGAKSSATSPEEPSEESSIESAYSAGSNPV